MKWQLTREGGPNERVFEIEIKNIMLMVAIEKKEEEG